MAKYEAPTLTAAADVDAAWREWSESTDRVALFNIDRQTEDGLFETVTYSMPRKANPGLALRFLKLARTQGDAASVWLIETACGPEAYDDLTDNLITYEGDAVAFLKTITDKIQSVCLGGLEAPKG